MELKPGYKQTEVGVIPEEWECRKLADLLEQSRHIRYGVVQPGKFTSSGCLMLRSQDYSKGWAGPDEMHRLSSQIESQYKNARICHNDLIMTVVGAGIGQVVTVPDWLDGGILSRSTARIAVDENIAASKYVRASLESPVIRRQILDSQKEGAQPVISCVDLAKFSLPLPPLPEQRAIAAALSDVDALIASLDKLITKKRDMKQAAMQELLTGKQRLPGFSGEWKVKRLGEIAEIKKGQLITEKTAKPGLIPVIAGGKQPAYYHNQPNRTGKTITVSASGASAGYVSFYSVPIFASDCSTISEAANYSIEYIYFQLHLQQEIIYKAQSGGAQPHIHPVDLAPLHFGCPPLPEQTAIAAILSDMNTEIAALEQKRDKTRLMKQGMMQELLTGRIRLV